MRINIYAEELPDDRELPERRTEIVTAHVEDRGVTFFGVRIFLKSADTLHDFPGDDDRSAITFWGPRERVARLLREAAQRISPEEVKPDAVSE